ncbi:MAG: tRNA (adenosine(37)-N6)-threonylcarbamoyltransferase complex dimerization subunit type 1 TsaB [Candidatus Margulisbacteria bacterium]|nr:tRNA (adenosine(37)-N6)-threonylcarbamoyltransferase complex dimerization subunit type 1 TsaB [Candidatus Margulisiibacteriota bacterium]MBU1022435.1 tRNA (adenosine(37)-N6)-threonylcarbamoyltransferase complex dimerization subunit type 1 TsaB [Candidatus Margulisiibacteriota bacterium]MBU1728419.1 tRNA (adenosine(37)-N6)-threonylcarbamoyltransferase complex dimerization subunit type 1 TsaB [Candidatus Margulisiibacteriota bacterium]MBU1954566.1 tRNA (adenosine(37)-N6)-threonylcarbamoyltransf
MYILGISSTTKILSVALISDSEVLAEFSVTGERSKAEQITLFVEESFKKAKLDINKVEAVAVTQGPGSYGGIRGGVTSAKSFAQVLKVPVIGVSTLEAMAYNFSGSNRTCMIILDAKSDEFNLALFADAKDGLKRLTDDFVISRDKLFEKIKQIDGNLIVAGALDKLDLPKELKNKDNLTFVSFLKSFPRAVNVAKIAVNKVKEAGLESFLSLIPKYSHRPNIKRFVK